MLADMIQASRTEKYEHMREMLNDKQWRHYLRAVTQESRPHSSVRPTDRDGSFEREGPASPRAFLLTIWLREESSAIQYRCLLFDYGLNLSARKKSPPAARIATAASQKPVRGVTSTRKPTVEPNSYLRSAHMQAAASHD